MQAIKFQAYYDNGQFLRTIYCKYQSSLNTKFKNMQYKVSLAPCLLYCFFFLEESIDRRLAIANFR